ELGDNGTDILIWLLEPQLVDAVLVRAERHQAAIAEQADARERVHHDVGGERFVRMGIRGSHAAFSSLSPRPSCSKGKPSLPSSRRCTSVSPRPGTRWSMSPDGITLTQASRAPGRMPSERSAAARNEYSVASLASFDGRHTMTIGACASCVLGKGLGSYDMPA